jgi:hypothetical protein
VPGQAATVPGQAATVPGQAATVPGQAATVPASGGKYRALLANGNLIEISDWLTKIIVGVGLIQLGSIPGQFQRLVDYARGAIGNPPGSESIVGALIVLYAVAGFMLTYLFTRTDLEADLEAIDALDRLPQLYDLRAKGILTEEEWDSIKKTVISNTFA